MDWFLAGGNRRKGIDVPAEQLCDAASHEWICANPAYLHLLSLWKRLLFTNLASNLASWRTFGGVGLRSRHVLLSPPLSMTIVFFFCCPPATADEALRRSFYSPKKGFFRLPATISFTTS